MEQVLILGTGCAGGTAAVYAARAGLEPIVYEGQEPGGQLTLTTSVENFPGFPEGIQGPELVEQIKKQAQRFGAEFRTGRATSCKQIEGGFEVTIDKKNTIRSRTVIVATGASARWLGLPSEERFKGRGVSTCATCDAFFYRGKPEVVVVGGGDSACEEALVLAKFAEHVTIVHRRNEMRASRIMQQRVLEHKKIDVLWDTVIEEICGDKFVESVKLKNTKTDEVSSHVCSGVFLAIGHIPNTKFLGDLVKTDSHGFIIADHTKTNVEGLFAAGDVQDPVYKQAVTAAGSGCMAALEAEKYLEQHYHGLE